MDLLLQFIEHLAGAIGYVVLIVLLVLGASVVIDLFKDRYDAWLHEEDDTEDQTNDTDLPIDKAG